MLRGARGRGRAAGAGAGAGAGPGSLGGAERRALWGEGGEARGPAAGLPAGPGVYALYDAAGGLQYVGVARDVGQSVAGHAAALGAEGVAECRAGALAEGCSKEELTAVWKSWVEEALEETGALPPGNLPGDERFQRPKQKPDVRLTPGAAAAQAMSVDITEMIRRVVADVPVVAFIKGSRHAPECGFSETMVGLLTENLGADFETVNVLDLEHNPGAREALKAFSSWPTIPQLYVGGEFVGGCDIVVELAQGGELEEVLRGGA